MFSGGPPESLRKHLTGKSVEFGVGAGVSDGNPIANLRNPGPVRGEGDLPGALRVPERAGE